MALLLHSLRGISALVASGDAAELLQEGEVMNWVVRNWLILAAALLLLTSLGGLLQGSGRTGVTLLFILAWFAVALLALVDGLLRLVGRPSLLGSGGSFSRLLALVQIGLALLLLSNLLSGIL